MRSGSNHEKLAVAGDVELIEIRGDGFPAGAHVVGFVGMEALSALFRLDVGVLLGEGQTLDDVVDTKATLVLNTPSGPVETSGIVAGASLVHVVDARPMYRVRLVPHLWRATLSQHSQVFVDRPVPEVLVEVLERAGVTDYELKLQGDYEPHELITQYRESDFAFLSRWMEREGIYYFFDHRDGVDKLILTDDANSHAEASREPVPYVPLSDDDHSVGQAFDRLTRRTCVRPTKVVVKDYAALHPTLDVSSEIDADTMGGGVVASYGDKARTPGQAERLATLRAERLRAESIEVTAHGRVFGLRPGFTFEVKEHPLDDLNATFQAVRLRHFGNQSATEAPIKRLLGLPERLGHDEYLVEVEALPDDVQFRPAPASPRPRVPGTEHAHVCGGVDSEYAQVDAHGRYHVRMHFDESDLHDGKASCWVRMIQPHGGTTEGHHLPLRKGTEVVLAFSGGDPDQPVIVGQVPNPTTPAPVTAGNHTLNVIQTGGRNRIEMQDKEGAQYIDMFSPPKDTFFHLGEPHAGHTHYLVKHTDGDCFVDIAGTRDIEIGGEQNEYVKGNVDETYDADQHTKIKGTETTDVGGKRTIDVGKGGQIEHVKGLVKETYKADHKRKIKGKMYEKATDVTEDYKSLETASGKVKETFGTHDKSVGNLDVTTGDVTLTYNGITRNVTGSYSLTIDGGLTILVPVFSETAPPRHMLAQAFKDFTPFKLTIRGISVGAAIDKFEMGGVAISAVAAKGEAGLFSDSGVAIRISTTAKFNKKDVQQTHVGGLWHI